MNQHAPSPALTLPADRILPAVGLMLVFSCVAPLIDVASKMAVQTVSTGTVTLARFLVQAALMAPIAWAMKLPMQLDARTAGLTCLRALAAVGSTLCFVAAMRVMPIADALAIAFLSPFLLLLMGRFLLDEQVGPRRLAACGVAFGGTVLVIQPSFVRFGATALLPLGTAVTFSLYMLVTRYLSRGQHPVTMQLHTAIAAALVCLAALGIGTAADMEPIRFTLPEGIVWGPVLAVGVAATVSHMAMTYALSLAPASTLAPLNYLEIVTATLFGFLFFGDFPEGAIWLGIAVIVASGLYVIHRERVQARSRRSGGLAGSEG